MNADLRWSADRPVGLQIGTQPRTRTLNIWVSTHAANLHIRIHGVCDTATMPRMNFAKNRLLLTVAFGLALLYVYFPSAETFTGKVVRIADGDTVTVLNSSGRIKIRLAEIDAPERNQPWGRKAKSALDALIEDQVIEIEQIDVDSYGRIVGRITFNGLDINREMVRNGHAWVYRQYLRDKSLLDVEAEAKAAKRGLWALPDAERMPPWKWRRLSQ